jgi:hypothetical protein
MRHTQPEVERLSAPEDSFPPNPRNAWDPPPPGRQETIAEAGERPVSSLRYLDGVPLWGDSDDWPRTAQEHAERDAFYTARRDLSEADRIDYNTVVHFGGQPPPEKHAARREQTRHRDGTPYA